MKKLSGFCPRPRSSPYVRLGKSAAHISGCSVWSRSLSKYPGTSRRWVRILWQWVFFFHIFEKKLQIDVAISVLGATWKPCMWLNVRQCKAGSLCLNIQLQRWVSRKREVLLLFIEAAMNKHHSFINYCSIFPPRSGSAVWSLSISIVCASRSLRIGFITRHRKYKPCLILMH